jgi:hypothetical protein
MSVPGTPCWAGNRLLQASLLCWHTNGSQAGWAQDLRVLRGLPHTHLAYGAAVGE